MAGTGRPWAVVITTVVAALVAASALAVAATLRHRAEPAAESETTEPSTPPGPGVDGCYVEPCEVLGQVPVGGDTVQLLADRGGGSARLRIGGAGSSEVIEVTITSMGATLTRDSLQCVVAPMIACLVRGQFDLGVVGQVVVGRSGKWSELGRPFQSYAGYLALADVVPDLGSEVLVAQHRCDRKVIADCSGTPVYIQVYNLRSELRGCTKNYNRLDSLPDWPTVTLTPAALRECTP